MLSNELLDIARLALEGKTSDVRLYLAKLVRKMRKSDPSYASRLEELLRIEPARSSGVMRKERLPSSVYDESQELSSLLRSTEGRGPKPLLEAALESQLQQILLERKSRQKLEAKGLEPVSSVVFQGPPGVGKTMAAGWLADQLGLPLYVLDLTAVMSSLLGKTGSNLRSVLDFAKSHPCVLFLDEIDAIAKKRNDESDVGEIKRLVNILLQEIERWPTHGMLIAATNHPEIVDPALWRRFDLEIVFSIPAAEYVRKSILEFLEDDINEFRRWIEFLVESQKGESYSNIKRNINRLRKLKVLNPDGFDEYGVKYLMPDLDGLTRKEKISLAVKLVSDFSFSQQKASQLTGVSRDTIRRRLSEKIV